MVRRVVRTLEGDHPVLQVVVYQFRLDTIVRVLVDFLKLLGQSLHNLGVHGKKEF